MEGYVDFAPFGEVGAGAILSARDDVQGAGERLFRQGAEIAFELQRGAGFAEPHLDVARCQDAVAILQLGLIESDDRRFLADEEVEAGGQVAILDPEFAIPGDAGAREEEGGAFRAHEESLAAEASDKVGALKVAGELEPGDDRGEGFEGQVARRGFHEDAGGLGAVECERLAELEGKQIQALAEDARIRRGDDGRFAGGAVDGGPGAHADALELIGRQILPVGLRGEFDDADVDVGDGGPGAIGAGAERERSRGDVAGGAAEAEGGERDGAVLGLDGELRVDLAHQRLAAALQRHAPQAVRTHAGDGGLAVLERDRSFAGPAAGCRDDLGGGEEGIERDEVGVVGGDGHRRVIGVFREQAAFPGECLRDGDRHAVARDGEAVDRETGRRALCNGRDLPFGTGFFGEGRRELAQVGPDCLEVGARLPAGGFDFPGGHP